MEYLYRRGRIVSTKSGIICKVIARPGQIVYNNKIGFIQVLKEGEYLLTNEDFRIIQGDFCVAQENTQPINGFLCFEWHILNATVYEKKLRRLGINNSPLFNSTQPDGLIDEIVVFKKLIFPWVNPRINRIKKATTSNIPLYELSNGEVIDRGTLRMFYRKPIPYEEKMFIKKEALNKKRRILLDFPIKSETSNGQQICLAN